MFITRRRRSRTDPLAALQSFGLTPYDTGAGVASLSLGKGSGSPTFTRATSAYTKLITGGYGSVASGVPRFSYIGRDTTAQTQGGYLSEVAATQLVTPTASIRDMTDASWVKTGVTPTKNASGITGSNLILRSEEFDNVYWVKSNLSVLANQRVSPFGTLTADLLTEGLDTAVSHGIVSANIAYTTGQVFTASGYYYPNGKTKFRSTSDSTSFGGIGQNVNFDTVALTAVTQSGTSTGSIVDVGGGWYRWQVNYIPTTTAGNNVFSRILFLNNAGTTVTYNGDGVSGAYIFGMQVEEGKSAGVYTPTVASTVLSSATTLTATAPAATVLQTLVAAASSRQYSAYVRRKTGTGTITLMNGTATLDITALINSLTYTRVQLNGNDLNAAFGFLIATSGDEIEVDFNQFEAGSEATSPIDTAGATRNADVLTYSTTNNIDFTQGTAYAELYANWTSANSSHDCIGVTGGARALHVGTSGGATITNEFDGTAGISKTGLTSMFTGVRKRACSWGSGGQVITGDGATVVTGSFDGAFGNAGVVSVGCSTGAGNQFNGIIKSVKIYNQQLPNATLQALTA